MAASPNGPRIGPPGPLCKQPVRAPNLAAGSLGKNLGPGGPTETTQCLRDGG